MKTVVRYLSKISGLIDLTVSRVYHNLDFENSLPGRNIEEILENPHDKLELEKAIEKLKQNKNQEYEDVKLSNNETLTISIS
ncbi:hypothetical protein CHU92_11180 [Flavobacterium cyanobacteriorum]|uniref:Uncharacterized protein n=1 Tax=Flavobacterium cyanobacteriorum TaxID=2022802 RepID=A0A255Z0V6_9FLAO|nr:hypothetical protein [Flavobacterium cyanobacteriorum]OYQ35133.1 hypothetical protein CHU92_11180 [Flavobacterium cyanobacteriorum]